MSTHNERGRDAENNARAHLERNGLKHITHNWSCRQGELDLVMLDGDTVVFVEVRARSHQGWGGALESITASKRRKLICAAEQFLQQHSAWAHQPCRFDVVAITLGSNMQLDWIRNAFEN